jgi:hypothetical protein
MSTLKTVQEILKKDPRAAILLAEILYPPPSISALPRPWES